MFLHQLLSCCKCCIAKMATVGCLSPGPSGQLIRRCRAYFRACVWSVGLGLRAIAFLILCSLQLSHETSLATSPTRITDGSAPRRLATPRAKPWTAWEPSVGHARAGRREMPEELAGRGYQPSSRHQSSLCIALIAPLADQSGLPQYPKRLWMDTTDTAEAGRESGCPQS